MTFFTFEDNFENGYENMLCAIFCAWDKALIVGYDMVSIIREPVEQLTFFDEYIHVDYDADKYNRIANGIKSKLSSKLLMQVYYAYLSDNTNSCDVIFRFLVKSFKYGETISDMYLDRDVMNMFKLVRNVSNEASAFREFVRFNQIRGFVYISHIEPKCNIVSIVGAHFANRMPSEFFIIIDDNRKLAVIHPKDGECYSKKLGDEEFDILQHTESKDGYSDLWHTFFDAISIKERENLKCQMNHFPQWKRKHATEFNHP